MKIDYERLKKITGIDYTGETEKSKNEVLLDLILNEIDYLYSHNKNYTKEQYYKIADLHGILNCIEKE